MRTYKGLIEKLEPNQVFVYGQNTQFRNGKGSALTAMRFGAVNGKGGLQGQTYGLITKDLTKRIHPSRTVEQIEEQIKILYEFASDNSDLEFFIAYSGKGNNLNAYTTQEMAQMFRCEIIPNNIIFEYEFSKLV